MAEWYYIGHYGQLGPLTQEQIEELVQGGVVLRETYVWRTGMPQWNAAGSVPELMNSFRLAEPFAAPPPPPMSATVMGGTPPQPGVGSGPYSFSSSMPASYQQQFLTVPSDRSRIAAGVLQILLPFGVGRLYLGYAAIGIMQLLLSFCGVGVIWSMIDGIAMLCGSTKFDGYGRSLKD